MGLVPIMHVGSSTQNFKYVIFAFRSIHPFSVAIMPVGRSVHRCCANSGGMLARGKIKKAGNTVAPQKPTTAVIWGHLSNGITTFTCVPKPGHPLPVQLLLQRTLDVKTNTPRPNTLCSQAMVGPFHVPSPP